jgi:hypothetical protein
MSRGDGLFEDVPTETAGRAEDRESHLLDHSFVMAYTYL